MGNEVLMTCRLINQLDPSWINDKLAQPWASSASTRRGANFKFPAKKKLTGPWSRAKRTEAITGGSLSTCCCESQEGKVFPAAQFPGLRCRNSSGKKGLATTSCLQLHLGTSLFRAALLSSWDLTAFRDFSIYWGA